MGRMAAAAPAAPPPPPLDWTHDLTDAINKLLSPFISKGLVMLGATKDHHQTYLLHRFLMEVVLPVVGVLLVYRVVVGVANGVQYTDDQLTYPGSPKAPVPKPQPATTTAAAPATPSSSLSVSDPSTASSAPNPATYPKPPTTAPVTKSVAFGTTPAGPGAESASRPPSGGLLRLIPVALTGRAAHTFLLLVLAVNVSRNTAIILEDFFVKFQPRLPYVWLDDAVRVLSTSLTPLDSFLTKLSLAGTTLFACFILLRWKDMSIAWMVKQHIEPLDHGGEVVSGFINPASNLANLIIIVGTVAWLAMHLGVNLQPLLAVGGASGIIIGLGTQQILGNFVSGLNIFLARPFVAGEYVSILGPTLSATQVSGKVVRVDPMRTLIATEEYATITVPNNLIAGSVVINRSRTPHWTVGSASPLLANTRELRFRMKVPHDTLSKLKELTQRIDETLVTCLPSRVVRHSEPQVELVRFTDEGADLVVKCNLAWRVRREGGVEPLLSRELRTRQETREAMLQRTLLELHAVVLAAGGKIVGGFGWT